MSAERDFRTLAAEPDPERYLPDLAPWVHEAANPYLDRLLGGHEPARAAVEAWMRSPGSEISLSRVVALFEDERPVGGYVGLSGADLEGCIRADSLIALKVVGREGRVGFLERARAVADLRKPVEPDEWFLSKLGVLEKHRRGGRGRALLEEFIAHGAREGFSRFRLDVWERDEHTVRLYESAGFGTLAESENEDLGLRLLAMRYEPGP